MYAVSVITEPEREPISLDEAKSHLRVPLSDQDGNIDRIYIPAARRRVEAETNRQLITATLELSLNRFPMGSAPICVPRCPMQSVTSITYRDTTGAEQVLDPSKYHVDPASEPGLIHPVFGSPWPAVRQRSAPSTVAVRFVAGYGATGASIPAGIREAMLLLIGHYYYHREDVVVGTISSALPRAVTDLLGSYGFGDEFVNYGGV